MMAVTQAEISHRLKLIIAVMIGRSRDEIAGDETMGTIDMDSVDSVELAMRMERELGQEIDPEIFLRSESTIDDIAGQLADILDR